MPSPPRWLLAAAVFLAPRGVRGETAVHAAPAEEALEKQRGQSFDLDFDLRHVDLPDYHHPDPCNPNLDLNAHSVDHHASGLARVNTWTPPPPGFTCPPPSPPPPPVAQADNPMDFTMSSISISAAPASPPPVTGGTMIVLSGTQSRCMQEAGERDYQLDGKSTEDAPTRVCFVSNRTQDELGLHCDQSLNLPPCDFPRTSSLEKIQVPNADFTVNAGYGTTCVATKNKYKCWGTDEAGKLGLRPPAARAGHAPMADEEDMSPVDDAENLVRMEIGKAITCQLFDTGDIMCWGADIATTGAYFYYMNRLTRYGARRKVDTLADRIYFSVEGDPFVHMSVGKLHMCGVTRSGQLACAGRETTGNMASGTTGKEGSLYGVYGTPTLNTPTSNVRIVQVAAGESHTCVLTDRAYCVCFGSNKHGELGVGDTYNRRTPESLQNLKPVALGGEVLRVSAGHSFSCAEVMPLDGPPMVVRCWGKNDVGQLGQGDVEHRGDDPDDMGSDNLPPVPFHKVYDEDLQPPKGVEVGADHACVMTRDHEIKCWGSNKYSQLGVGDYLHRGPRPDDLYRYRVIDLGVGRKAFALSTGESHTCALTFLGDRPSDTVIHEDGPCLVCWGDNSAHELGYGDSYLRTNADYVGSRGVSSDLCMNVMATVLQQGVMYDSAYASGVGGAVRAEGRAVASSGSDGRPGPLTAATGVVALFAVAAVVLAVLGRRRTTEGCAPGPGADRTPAAKDELQLI
mmetsp:Transcript_3610/g.10628  ORF Transcript_3610/g.10628 Transcript_3610/m.10628 type:complete len:739 (-) Transcript_3610:472-2688(-)